MGGLIVDSFAGGGGASLGLSDADVRRFVSFIDATADGGCWEWRGTRQRRANGALSYGRFRANGRSFLAHRLAYMLANGAVAGGRVVRHTCDNTGCVRPEHLVDGTQAQNLSDMRERGRAYHNRFPAGRRHPNAKVDEAKVRQVRALRTSGLSLAKIASRIGLHPSTVHDIVRRRTWREVP